MSDQVLSFSPEVQKFVDDALKNKTAIARLRPYLTDPKRNTKYDNSEFYQARVACSLGTIDKIPEISGFYRVTPEQSGKLCDKILITAADQMKKGVPVEDPTHLLAPYLLSQTNRGYSNADGTPLQNALAGAKVAAELNKTDERTDGTPVVHDLRHYLKPAYLPKNVSADQPLLLASTKGNAKDAAFSYSTAVSYMNQGAVDLTTTGYVAPNIAHAEIGLACNQKDSNVSRSNCVAIGYSLADRYKSRDR